MQKLLDRRRSSPVFTLGLHPTRSHSRPTKYTQFGLARECKKQKYPDYIKFTEEKLVPHVEAVAVNDTCDMTRKEIFSLYDIWFDSQRPETTSQFGWKRYSSTNAWCKRMACLWETEDTLKTAGRHVDKQGKIRGGDGVEKDGIIRYIRLDSAWQKQLVQQEWKNLNYIV